MGSPTIVSMEGRAVPSACVRSARQGGRDDAMNWDWDPAMGYNTRMLSEAILNENAFGAPMGSDAREIVDHVLAGTGHAGVGGAGRTGVR